MLYRILSHRHAEYTPDRYKELDDLYVGGYQLLDRAKDYIHAAVGEHPSLYEERVKNASYINYLGQIVDFFVANLFGQEITVTQAADADDPNTPGSAIPNDKFYGEFAHDADLKGNAFATMLRTAMPMALLKKRAIIGVDLPKTSDEAPVMNRAQEDAIGAARAYLIDIPIEQLTDWEHDDQGHHKWAILHRVFCERNTPLDDPDLVTEEFRVWYHDRATGIVRWELYQKKRKAKEIIKPEEDLQPVGEGETSFPWIPIIEITMPNGLWVGNKLACLAREHFQRRNALTSAENKSLMAIPVAALGSEIPAVGGALPSDAQQNPSRLQGPKDNMISAFLSKGYLVTGADDKIYFAAPDGSCYVIVYDQLEKLVDEMFRIVHQMAASVASTSTAMGRSGMSKREDRSATEVVLNAFGALVRHWAKQIYDTVAAARNDKHVVWTPRGLDKFELSDRETVLEEATSLEMVTIPSATFKKTWQMKVAMALLGDVPPETQDIIREEIEDGVDHAEELAKIQETVPDENGVVPATGKIVAPKVPPPNSPKAPKPKKPAAPKSPAAKKPKASNAAA